jgi:ABC-type uncharacterized transport system ATPase subunit
MLILDARFLILDEGTNPIHISSIKHLVRNLATILLKRRNDN